jgi:hypothetical protein
MSYLLLLNIKGRTDLNNILREYGSLQCDPKELYRIFKSATEKKDDELPFLKLIVVLVIMILNLAETSPVSYHSRQRFNLPCRFKFGNYSRRYCTTSKKYYKCLY